MSIHLAAARGFHGELYERGRPSYPAEAVDAIVATASAGAGPVLDLGAGTGKLTRSLVERGLRTVAVDPLPDMLAALRRTSPDVPVAVGTAERIPLVARAVRAVFCAQAFHWFRPEEALSEIHRVLAPGGVLGLIWNRRDVEVGWVARLWTGIIEPNRGDVPGHETVEWRSVLEASPLFGPVTEQVFGTAQRCDVDTLIARIDSTSFINTLEPDVKASLFERVREFCATDPELGGRAAFDLPYRTLVYSCRAS